MVGRPDADVGQHGKLHRHPQVGLLHLCEGVGIRRGHHCDEPRLLITRLHVLVHKLRPLEDLHLLAGSHKSPYCSDDARRQGGLAARVVTEDVAVRVEEAHTRPRSVAASGLPSRRHRRVGVLGSLDIARKSVGARLLEEPHRLHVLLLLLALLLLPLFLAHAGCHRCSERSSRCSEQAAATAYALLNWRKRHGLRLPRLDHYARHHSLQGEARNRPPIIDPSERAGVTLGCASSRVEIVDEQAEQLRVGSEQIHEALKICLHLVRPWHGVVIRGRCARVRRRDGT